MILHPAIVALLLVSLLLTGMCLYSAFFGIRIIRRWDLASGSEEQLDLERKTYLISTILSYVFAFQIGSLFLFIFTAESLHDRFVGAMCAAGALYANPYGYPAFLLKILNVLLAGIWLVVNAADNRAYDYPLIRKKYLLLLVLTPFVAAESVAQALYFTGLKADVITSCCGSLFSAAGTGVSSDIASFPPRLSMTIFYLVFAATVGAGLLYRFRRKMGVFFSLSSGLFFLVACASFISFISLYFYELPTHHCPFCVLQKEYGYVGYFLYAALLAGAVSGLGVGALMPYGRIGSLAAVLPALQKRLALACLIAYAAFVALSTWRIVATDFTLGL